MIVIYIYTFVDGYSAFLFLSGVVVDRYFCLLAVVLVAVVAVALVAM